MITALLRYLAGYVKIGVSGYSIERFINICRLQNIRIWNLKSIQCKYEMYISRTDFKKVRAIRRKVNVHVEIMEKHGLLFLLHRYRQRKMFFLGAAIFCMCMCLYSNLIWKVELKGNHYYTEPALQSYLDSQNIHAGVRVGTIDCEEIARKLRIHYNDIVWVSASLDGCRLLIHMKENTQQKIAEKQEAEAGESNAEGVSNIVASKSGTIKEIITRSGIPMVHVGDQVNAGDILVSGYVPVMDDAGEIQHYILEKSDADILAATTYTYEDLLPVSYTKKKYDTKTAYQCYIKVKPWMLALGTVSREKNTELMTEEFDLKPFRSFSFPVKVGVRYKKSYTNEKKKYSQKQMQQILSGHFRDFCLDLEKKGVQISSNSVKINLDVSAAHASGTIETIERIGMNAAAEQYMDTETNIETEERISTE